MMCLNIKYTQFHDSIDFIPTPINTPLFYLSYNEDDIAEYGAFGRHVERVFEWREGQSSTMCKIGAKVVTFIASNSLFLLSLAETVTSFTLASIAFTLMSVASPIGLTSWEDRVDKELLARTCRAAYLSFIMIKYGYMQLIEE
ncbi:MAG: hypothetical protein WD595_05800 [Waddliaceae bacterium]